LHGQGTTASVAGPPRKLQLGAFDHAVDGWINTDVTPHLMVARVPGFAGLLHAAGVIDNVRYEAHRAGAFRTVAYLDVAHRFPYPDGSFGCVYASHLLEHLHPDVAERCLREARRVLANGGVLRLAVPDLDELVAAYDPHDPDAFLWGIYQGRGSRAKRTARHWWHYNAGSLQTLLQNCGYREVQRCAFREGRCADLDRIETRRWSLFMEADK
jgi:SAM-dependent methyltransferase